MHTDHVDQKRNHFRYFIKLKFVYILIFLMIALKVSTWIYLQLPLFSVYASGNDADLYHRYVIGEINRAPNLWPIILKFLNSVGLYDRYGIAFIIFLTTLSLIPGLIYYMIKEEMWFSRDKSGSKLYFNVIFAIVLYPSTFIFSLDLYRDLFMVNVLLASLLCAQKFINYRSFTRWVFLLIFLNLGVVLFFLRPYLGAALFAAFFTYFIISYFQLKAKLLLFLTILSLIIMHNIGWLDYLIIYRGEDGFEGGSTTFGIGLLGKNTFSFLMLTGLSTLYQVIGLYMVTPILVIVFFTESLIVILAGLHISKNMKHMSKFGYFLLVFLAFYTFVWVIGNDNMGTALRLRIPTYLGVFLLFGIVEAGRLNALAKEKMT